MKKSGIFAGLLLVAAGGVRAQESASVYHFLQFPQAAHTTALGGVNISAVDDDAAAALNNPALLSTVSDKTLSLNFMTYAAGSKQVGATFVKAFGERHTAALEAHYFGYGTMDETDNAGNVVGSFSAKDIAVTAGYAYLLNDRWATFNVREDLLGDLQMGKEFTAFVPAFNKDIKLKVTYLKDRGSYAAWKATKTTGQFDLKTFEVRAIPMENMNGLRPGMSVIIEK